MKTIAHLSPADTRMIDLRRSLPSLHSSLSPCRSPQESEEWEADRQAQLADAQEAARGMRRLFLATLLFWAAIYGWYLHAH
jgi:2-polyprenyl-6-methoxyphenol hydroxylase-like FAD-dependent oxidoreductase